MSYYLVARLNDNLDHIGQVQVSNIYIKFLFFFYLVEHPKSQMGINQRKNDMWQLLRGGGLHHLWYLW
jgi:hypothetical protein